VGGYVDRKPKWVMTTLSSDPGQVTPSVLETSADGIPRGTTPSLPLSGSRDASERKVAL
jgi:hypothetical protein